MTMFDILKLGLYQNLLQLLNLSFWEEAKLSNSKFSTIIFIMVVFIINTTGIT